MTTTTLVTALAALKTLLDGVTSAGPDGDAATIRTVFWGQGAPTDVGLPFLALQLISAKRVGVVDGATEWEALVKLRVVWDVAKANTGHNDGLYYTAQIEDLLDGWLPQAGLEGGENSTWAYTLPREPSHGQTGFAESELTLRIRTTRGSN